jgi:hypothetical protein
VWPAELRVDELVALDESDAQLSWHNTTTGLDLWWGSSRGIARSSGGGAKFVWGQKLQGQPDTYSSAAADSAVQVCVVRCAGIAEML